MTSSISRRAFVCASALVSAGVLSLLAGCGGSEPSTAEDVQADGVADADDLGLVVPGKLTVGSDCDYPPFIWMEGEQPAGFEYDLLKAVCEQMGLELNYLAPQKFDTLVPSIVAGGKMDVAVSSVTVTDERLEEIDFTDPYCDSNQSLTVLSDSGYASRDDLEGKNIAVQSGTTGEAWAKENIAGATVTPFDDQSSAFAALVAGKVDAVCQDLPISQYMVSHSYPECAIIEEIPTGEQYAMAVSKDNAALREAIDEALAALVDDGTIDSIYERYISGE